MDEPSRSELNELLAAQRALREQVSALDSKIDALRQRMDAARQRPHETAPPVQPESIASRPPPIQMTSEAEQVAARLPDAPSPQPQPQKKSFEFQLGTVWLVRIGIVMLLTGLIFLGNYAYQNFIGRIGPLG